MVKSSRFRSRSLRFALPLLALAAAPALPAMAQDLLLQDPPASGFRLPPGDVGGGRILVAQNQQSAAQLMVRIQDLEGQLRTATGQIEGLQFQLTQMQQMIERMTEDYEFRFQALEGGAGGKPQAARPTDGVTPSDTLPPTSAPDRTAAAPALPPLAAEDLPAEGDAAAAGPEDRPLDLQLGDSQDPMLRGGTGQLGSLGPEDQLSIGGPRPLDLSAAGADRLSQGDARAQYAAGYDAMTRGDYAFAEDQFTQFIALYPADPQAPDATNWLGEALLQRQAYTDAAQVLADGYTKYKDSKRAPDMMLKLGVALSGADQPEVACRTFSTLATRYPNLAPAFRERLVAENGKAKCPAIP